MSGQCAGAQPNNLFKFGTVNALLGGVDHAAVDPNNGDVYYVYGDRDGTTGNNRLSIRRLTDNGAGGLTVGAKNFVTGQVQAALPSVAVAANGVVGVLYTQYDGVSGGFPSFSAHLATSSDQGVTFTDTTLESFLSPSTDNGGCRQRVLGDYQQMKAVGNIFYGVFTGNGVPFGRTTSNLDAIFFKMSATPPPSLSTNVVPSTVGIGSTFVDTATLTGGFNPTGNITFSIFPPANSTCSGSPSSTQTVAVSGAGMYPSSPITTGALGTYHVIASYSGDTNNFPVMGTCTDANESVMVTKATPTIATMINVSSPAPGGSISDTATVSGGFTPTGTVTFQLYGFIDNNCSGTPVLTSTVPLSGGQATSTAFVAPMVGFFHSIATYNGDANNNSVATVCSDPGEIATISGSESKGTGSVGGASFSYSVQRKKGSKETLTYSDPSSGISFSTKKITSLVFVGNEVTFSGSVKLGRKGPTVSFTVNAFDNGVGSSDAFSIMLSNGYSNSGTLSSGMLFIH
jgi:hypothetical protein